MTTDQSKSPDLNQLAIEACDMWQEHLSSLAKDPAARADLTRLLEPQRRMFADWAAVMQKGGKTETHAPRTDAPAAAKPEPAATTAPAPSPGSAAGGDDPLRVAQLALRVAELEKRLARLESAAAKPATSRRTQRTTS